VKYKTFYIGYSDNINRRFKEHNSGKTKSTNNKAPYKLIYCEFYRSKKDARSREINLKKQGMQREFLLNCLEDPIIK